MLAASVGGILPGKRPPPRAGNRQPRHPDQPPPRAHGPPLCGRKSVAHQVMQRPYREAVRQHDRLGASVRAAGEQLERFALVGGHRYSEEYDLQFIDDQTAVFPTAIIDAAFTKEVRAVW
jgi:hypothetical protein